MGMPATRIWTRAEVLALPDDGQRHELVDGELLVTPSPRYAHQFGVGELHVLLVPYVRAHSLGRVSMSPADLDLQSGHLIQPDLFVASLVDGNLPQRWEDVGIPTLVVEVLSPSTAQVDRLIKRRLYQRVGVLTYWIVDLDGRVVEVWTPGADRPVVVDGELIWHPDPAVPALAVDLPAYFRRVWGEE